MKDTNKLWLIAAIIAGIALAFSGCEGPVGPQGEKGDQGEQGTQGISGTSIVWQGDSDEEPENPQEGWAYYNTDRGRAYIYRNGEWRQMSAAGEDGAPGEPGSDGIGFYWLGSFDTAPANPRINEAYFNNTDRNAYIWKGPPRNWIEMLVGEQIGGGGATHDLPELIISDDFRLAYACEVFSTDGLVVKAQVTATTQIPLPDYWYVLYWKNEPLTPAKYAEITATAGSKTIRVVDIVGRWGEFTVTAKGHSWGASTPPTCVSPTILGACTVCSSTTGNPGTVEPALGHIWGSWSATTPSPITDITAAVSMSRLCSRNTGPACTQEPNGTSLSDLLSKLPANTAATAYNLVVNINELGAADTAGSFANIIYNNPTKFVSLDMSGSTFAVVMDRAFARSSRSAINLTGITLPNSVTSIGDWAFAHCISLASVVIPDSVTSIGDLAFVGCTSLASVNIPNGVTSIGNGAFASCTSLASIVIPDSVTTIGGNAFDGCSSLVSINIPDGVTSIEFGTFYGCTSLASITIPNSVTSIENVAFYDCTSLTSVTFEGNISAENFATSFPFPGDLRAKYLAGGIGTYTRVLPSSPWTKQP